MENTNMELKNQNAEVATEEKTEKKGLGTKIVNGVKKHWKGALLTVGGVVLGFIAGSRFAGAGDSEDADMVELETDEYTVEDAD